MIFLIHKKEIFIFNYLCTLLSTIKPASNRRHLKKLYLLPMSNNLMLFRMTKAVLELREVMPSISSFKPHLNTHECHLNMIVNNKINIPLKM